MGEERNQPFPLSCHAALKIGSQRSQVASDDGLVVVRDLDERLGLGEPMLQDFPGSAGYESGAVAQ
jgi:hypothetical protein